MVRAVVRSRGQVTLPKEVREALHIEEGDDVALARPSQCLATRPSVAGLQVNANGRAGGSHPLGQLRYGEPGPHPTPGTRSPGRAAVASWTKRRRRWRFPRA